MSRKPNPALLGAFLVAGLVLAVGALVFFTSAELFSKSENYILYFDSSVKGLNPGAPVKFRGVTVGTVRDVLIRHSQRASDVHIPVIISVDEALIRKKTDRTIDLSDDVQFEAMIRKGMRGVLQPQSFLTGILYVELDVLPNSPTPRLHQIGKEYKEIPTVPAQFEMLFDKLSEIDFKKTLDQLNSVLSRLDTRLDELKMAEISDGLTELLTNVNQLAKLPDLTNSLISLNQTLQEYRRLSETVRVRVDPLADRAGDTLAEAQTTMNELRAELQNLRDLLAPQASLRRDLSLALGEVAEAARSIGGLADFLTRHPDALLRGRNFRQPEP
ncbi:MAG: MlaD family protein [Verrucomicrobiota bacterium]